MVAGTIGWFSLDKETRGLLATLPTNRDVLFWTQPQRDAAFRALDRLPPGFAPLDEAGFRSELAARFPWLTPQDFAELRDIAAAARPALVATAAASHHR